MAHSAYSTGSPLALTWPTSLCFDLTVLVRTMQNLIGLPN